MNSCGNFEKQITKLEKRIETFDERSEDSQLDEVAQEELKQCQWELWEVLKLQESLWKQKSRMKWLKEGDSNTTFFHRATKVRANRRGLNGLMIENGWTTEPDKLRRQFYGYFKNHFSCKNRKWRPKLAGNFLHISEAMSNELVKPFTEDESILRSMVVRKTI
ncbi:hypothetical protein V6N13_108234 [Hibiscus sabdariffa]